jgi:hypothetical protein
MEVVIGAAILWVLPIYVTHKQGEAKHRTGAAWGVFLGWIGVLVLALLPDTQAQSRLPEAAMMRCPHCAEDIRVGARICKHCGHDVAAVLPVG